MAQQQQQGPPDQLLALPGFGDGDDDDDGQAGALPPRPPWWRRRGGIIGLILLAILIAGGIILFPRIFPSRRPVAYQTQRVTRGDLVLTISATGPLQAGIYNVNFKGMGTIAKIDVYEGQMVTKGQVVAELDKVSLQDAVATAQANYQAALTTLNTDMANSGATQGQTGANVASAQTTLSNAQTNLAKVKAQSTATVSAAQTTLTNAQASLSAAEAQGQASVSAAQATLTNAEASLAAAQQQAQANINAAQATETSALAACNPATPPTTAQQNCINVATTQFNQAVAAANTSVTTAQTMVNNAQAGLNTAEATANTSDTTAQTVVNNAQAGLTTAQKLADENNATAQSQVNAAQAGVNTSQATGNLSNTTSQSTVSNARSQVSTMLDQLQTAQHNLANATLTAPHAGIVTVINGTVGGTPGVPKNATVLVTGGTTGTFMQIVDSATLQAVAAVNESDTANLRVGDVAQFTVSAFGTRMFTGVVSAISPNGQTVSNVVTFPVYVDVDKTDLQGATLLPNMTANLTIDVAKRTGVLLVPVNAVNFARSAILANATTGTPSLISPRQAAMATAKANQLLQQLLVQNPSIAADNPTAAFLLEQSATGFITKPIVLGLTDGTSYEVLGGLSPGEIIIVGTKAPTPGGAGGTGGGPGGGPGGG